ncbi:hypothetical protein KEM60_03178 [Austwickia sp. TVS 96-490-7B]|uniref:hypothetical protein n=1 Tax=Austwickia sp. TVS 96-490-7B TaxID=2830843 RepID=UPI001C58FE45|nr:hypothetical protein [Austwickia sp. TVS 96-490-7B]MBW3086949.1 hypothetical protein [Austwickia sp. TVS 96-490-7B]
MIRAVRAGFIAIQEANDAVRQLGRLIEILGSLKGTIPDPSKQDKLFVPIGINGRVVYQIKLSGNATLKIFLTVKR